MNMIIGAGQSTLNNGAAEKTEANLDYIFDVSTQDFEEKVVKASMEKPVLVDFWAPWCGPCKTLMPVLEEEVKKAQGSVHLAKVNLDENQQLAGMLRVQSVPTVYAFYQGQPVTGFQGNQPASQIEGLIKQLIDMAGLQIEEEPLDVAAMLEAADQAVQDKQLDGAMALYKEVLQVEPTNPQAYCALAKLLLQVGQQPEAMAMYEQAPDVIKKTQEFQSLQSTIELLSTQSDTSTEKLQKTLNENPEEHQTRQDLAEALFKEGEEEQAIETLLEGIKLDREWNDGAAKALLLKFFESLGHKNPITIAGRKKLSSILFS